MVALLGPSRCGFSVLVSIHCSRMVYVGLTQYKVLVLMVMDGHVSH